ncbi:MAG: DUF2877 domain-containing protein [Clostridiales bacterium]|nr:DUF2877 domain-containing protein [Clostridiales bacterium]
MMNATAVCKRLLSLSLEQSRSGTVHSVFDRAVNLEVGGGAGFIGLIAQQGALTPYAVSVRTEHPFPEAGVRAGMAAAILGGKILIPQAELEIDLTNAEPVDLRVDSIELRYGGEAERALMERIVSALGGADAEASLAALVIGGTGNAYTKFLAPRLEQLYAAVSVGAREAAALAAARTAGCGMGLTPSSDDLLTGYFTTLHLLFRAEGREHLRGILPTMARAAAEKTNRISGTFLLHGGEGLANAAMCDLYRSTFQFMDTAAAKRAAERVLAIGSTSGADMLTGAALALLHHGGTSTMEGTNKW